jgi:hypothetical protein
MSLETASERKTKGVMQPGSTCRCKNERNNSDKTVYCKNIFLKDRKGKFYYIICHEDNNVNLRQLKYKLHAHRNRAF